MIEIVKAPQAYAAEIHALGFSANDYRRSKYFELMSDSFNNAVCAELNTLAVMDRIKVGTVYSMFGEKLAYMGEVDGKHIVSKGTGGLMSLTRSELTNVLGDATPSGTIAFLTI